MVIDEKRGVVRHQNDNVKFTTKFVALLDPPVRGYRYIIPEVGESLGAFTTRNVALMAAEGQLAKRGWII